MAEHKEHHKEHKDKENHEKRSAGADKNESVEESISQDYVPKSKLGNLPMSNQIPPELQKQMNKT